MNRSRNKKYSHMPLPKKNSNSNTMNSVMENLISEMERLSIANVRQPPFARQPSDTLLSEDQIQEMERLLREAANLPLPENNNINIPDSQQEALKERVIRISVNEATLSSLTDILKNPLFTKSEPPSDPVSPLSNFESEVSEELITRGLSAASAALGSADPLPPITNAEALRFANTEAKLNATNAGYGSNIRTNANLNKAIANAAALTARKDVIEAQLASMMEAAGMPNIGNIYTIAKSAANTAYEAAIQNSEDDTSAANKAYEAATSAVMGITDSDSTLRFADDIGAAVAGVGNAVLQLEATAQASITNLPVAHNIISIGNNTSEQAQIGNRDGSSEGASSVNTPIENADNSLRPVIQAVATLRQANPAAIPSSNNARMMALIARATFDGIPASARRNRSSVISLILNKLSLSVLKQAMVVGNTLEYAAALSASTSYFFLSTIPHTLSIKLPLEALKYAISVFTKECFYAATAAIKLAIKKAWDISYDKTAKGLNFIYNAGIAAATVAANGIISTQKLYIFISLELKRLGCSAIDNLQGAIQSAMNMYTVAGTNISIALKKASLIGWAIWSIVSSDEAQEVALLSIELAMVGLPIYGGVKLVNGLIQWAKDKATELVEEKAKKIAEAAAAKVIADLAVVAAKAAQAADIAKASNWGVRWAVSGSILIKSALSAASSFTWSLLTYSVYGGVGFLIVFALVRFLDELSKLPAQQAQQPLPRIISNTQWPPSAPPQQGWQPSAPPLRLPRNNRWPPQYESPQEWQPAPQPATSQAQPRTPEGNPPPGPPPRPKLRQRAGPTVELLASAERFAGNLIKSPVPHGLRRGEIFKGNVSGGYRKKLTRKLRKSFKRKTRRSRV